MTTRMVWRRSLATVGVAVTGAGFLYRKLVRQPILTYTYAWIENLLGLNMHSADRVLPEFQHPEIGDGFGFGFGANLMTYAIVEPQHALAVRSADGNWVWSFILDERDGQTRLISRNRFRLPKLKDKIGMIPMEPGSLLMERKMLFGIKERAERLKAEEEMAHA